MELLNQLIKITQFMNITSVSTTDITFNVINEVMVKVNQRIILLCQLHNHVYLVYLWQLLLQFDNYRIFLIFLWIQLIWYKIHAEPIQNITNGNITSNISLSNYFYESWYNMGPSINYMSIFWVGGCPAFGEKSSDAAQIGWCPSQKCTNI